MAPGAFHNSDERYDPPKCHPHTRRAVLKKIEDWVRDANKVALFLWLYGPAGSGKSAIAQSIAELLEEAGLLAAAFFFSRNAAGRNDKAPLVATLVYQLIISIPEVRGYVLEALDQDPAVFSRSIQAQIKVLVVKPLNTVAKDETLAPTLLSRPRLIILDGLDECRTSLAQIHILNAISTAMRRLRIPLCFLIASRPEQHIREAFNDQSHNLGSLSFSIALDDTYEPDSDIEVFLWSAFDEIKRKHPSRAHLPTSWPSSGDIRRLVAKSSGQFIFASTVTKYVNSHRHWPPDRLKIVFGQSKSGQETPFAELDTLYSFILSSVADIEKVKDVLMILVLLPLHGMEALTYFIEKFLFYRVGELDMILSDLHSIISVPPPGDGSRKLQSFHASLADFLLDRSRSGDLFLDEGAAYAELTRLAVKHLNDLPASPLTNDRYWVHFTFRFCCVKAHPSPMLLKDLQTLNLDAHFYDTSAARIPELICWFERQWLNTDRTETLLSHHLPAIDAWIRVKLGPWARRSSLPHLLAAITLVDEIDPEAFGWQRFSAILQSPIESIHAVLKELADPVDLFHRKETPKAFFRILSKFLTDRERAGDFWVNSRTYANLAKKSLRILRAKRFTDIDDIHAQPPAQGIDLGEIAKRHINVVYGMHWHKDVTYHKVGKLAFNLLRLLLSRIEILGGPEAHEVMVLLKSHPPFHLIKNDPLESEKVKAAQAIEEFLKKRGDIAMPFLIPRQM
ncbi:hypothetical protein M413DRAFT_443169 [Hebeloma cylindrosporum]|uniref:Nephrocystin 3-like N-terminal domain-containing protein n=1 Tax=Hebeloma cylindrosporum TaxID=76867 RepID=A0A0C2YT25_HEBCY|nr:hypothetical protein M413DRAFT_443169 [Hebeloma cylindrosporum h7]